MCKTLRNRLPALAAFALIAVAGSPAFSQTPPAQSPATSREGVREILNRAETEGTRRTLGDVLGAVAGVSRAQAQTAPAQNGPAQPRSAATPTDAAPAQSPSAGPVQAGPSGGPVAATRAERNQVGPAAPAAPASQTASGAPRSSGGVRLSQTQPQVQAPAQMQIQAQAQPRAQARGTVTDPTMIVRVPNAGPAPANRAAAVPSASAPAQPAQAPVPTASGPATAAAPAVVQLPAGPRTIVRSAAPGRAILVRRGHEHVDAPVWCPPRRW